MKKILRDSFQNNKIVSIYTNSNTDHFSVGIINGLSKDFISFQSISTMGKVEGMCLIPINSIFRVNSDGKYEKRMLRLWEFHNQSVEYTFLEDINIDVFLNYSLDNNLVVSLELCESGEDDVSGYIEVVGMEEIQVRAINEYGEDDGLSVIKKDSITRISSDTGHEKNLRILSRFHIS